jgi:opacity protein-like surface antigen
MRRLSIAAGLMVCALALPGAASAQNGQIQGFGGLTFGDVTTSSTFGGGIAVPLGDTLQIVAEGGEMRNVVPSLLGTIGDFTPFDARVSAWYGEAGVRLIGPSRNTIRPYGEATAGFARMRARFDGFGPNEDTITNTALGFFDRTEPLLGVGVGVVVQGGPVFLDLGYRYKKILGRSSVQPVLTAGDVSVNQMRIGVGFRF